MATLSFSEPELMRSHRYARAHEAAGRRLHGGFDEAGRYVPPRTLVRTPALEAWTARLRARGGDLLPADASLLAGIRVPSEAQLKLLIREGLGQTFWNMLTITGKIEARGRVLAELSFPELQPVLEDDASQMAIGHLNRGLLRAHGLDEGGEPARGIGGHDVMWFALRDLAFGAVTWPDAVPPDNIARPEPASQRFPGLPLAIERTIYFLINLLMIEFRAELGFSLTERLLRDPELFVERRKEAEEAAALVGRIRLDEAVHVTSLRLYLGELRSVTFRTSDGGRMDGAEVVDPLWAEVVRWATVEQPPLVATQQRALLTRRILEHADGRRILAEFEALAGV